MDDQKIIELIVGDPKSGVAGLQNDWWTGVAPDFKNSHGSYLKDLDGEEYLDLCGFFATAPIRYDHPRLWEDDFIEKIGKVALYRPSLSDFWTVEMAEFIETFREVATPDYFHHYFFIEGGAAAVENALKASFDWKVRLNIQKGRISGDPQEERRPLGTGVICLENAFHGRTLGTLSLTHTNDPRKYKYFPKYDWFRVEPPVLKFNCEGDVVNGDEVEERLNVAIEEMKNIIKGNPDDIACIIAEPIQGEGGDNHIPGEFFRQLRTVCDENDIILVYDEIQSGMGITGEMWCYQNFGDSAVPDIIAFGKKTQLCGIMANHDRFALVEENVFGSEKYDSFSRLNSTWGGNPVDMVRCTRFLEIIRDENLVENAREMGEYFQDGLRDICRKYDDTIDNPRGRGLFIAFDVKNPDKREELLCEHFKDQLLLALTCGERGIRFRPHLDITRDEVDTALNRIERSIKEIR